MSPSLGAATKPPRDIQLTSEIVASLLEDPSFYGKCPAFMFMREQGLASVARWKEAIANFSKECAGCGGSFDDRDILRPAVASFLKVVIDLHDYDPGLLLPLREFMDQKVRYPLGRVTLYYMSGDTKRSLQF